MYGPGAYFGNSPASVASYVDDRAEQGVQAYLLPDIGAADITYFGSRVTARRRRDQVASHLFPVGLAARLEQMVSRSGIDGSPPQFWARMPTPGAEAVINEMAKLAYPGSIGVGTPRFRSVARMLTQPAKAC